MDRLKGREKVHKRLDSKRVQNRSGGIHFNIEELVGDRRNGFGLTLVVFPFLETQIMTN